MSSCSPLSVFFPMNMSQEHRVPGTPDNLVIVAAKRR